MSAPVEFEASPELVSSVDVVSAEEVGSVVVEPSPLLEPESPAPGVAVPPQAMTQRDRPKSALRLAIVMYGTRSLEERPSPMRCHAVSTPQSFRAYVL